MEKGERNQLGGSGTAIAQEGHEGRGRDLMHVSGAGQGRSAVAWGTGQNLSCSSSGKVDSMRGVLWTAGSRGRGTQTVAALGEGWDEWGGSSRSTGRESAGTGAGLGERQVVAVQGCLVGPAGQEQQVNSCVGRAVALHSRRIKGTVCSEEMVGEGDSEAAVT